MNRMTATLIGLTAAALLLTGCTAVAAGPLDSKPTATATATPVAEAPVVQTTAAPVDPVAKAAADSGLSAKTYAEVTTKAKAIKRTDMTSFTAAVGALATEYGKPIVIVGYTQCINSDGNEWGIGGALVATAPPGCASGYAASREAALAKVKQRAEDKGWAADDYIVIFG